MRISLASVALVTVATACGPGARPSSELVDANPNSPIDGEPSTGADAGPVLTDVSVYANTDTALYKVDPSTLVITEIGSFAWPSGDDQMTDIAVDKDGNMVGISFTSLYSVDVNTAAVTLLNDSIGDTFNGLSYVPATQLGITGDDVLVASRAEDGEIFELDPNTGVATQIGDMGGTFASSGDIVSVVGLGTFATVTSSRPTDVLAQLATTTFAGTGIGIGTGYTSLWGVAFFGNKIYGFSSNGDFILIDPTTGVGTLVGNSPVEWWGAAVTTTAPVIQ